MKDNDWLLKQRLFIKMSDDCIIAFKSNVIQEERLFLPHAIITLLVIRCVCKDYVWVLGTKETKGNQTIPSLISSNP